MKGAQRLSPLRRSHLVHAGEMARTCDTNRRERYRVPAPRPRRRLHQRQSPVSGLGVHATARRFMAPASCVRSLVVATAFGRYRRMQTPRLRSNRRRLGHPISQAPQDARRTSSCAHKGGTASLGRCRHDRRHSHREPRRHASPLLRASDQAARTRSESPGRRRQDTRVPAVYSISTLDSSYKFPLYARHSDILPGSVAEPKPLLADAPACRSR